MTLRILINVGTCIHEAGLNPQPLKTSTATINKPDQCAANTSRLAKSNP